MLLRFPDLAQYGVHNYPTLKRWIEKQGAPKGRWLGPNTHVWDKAGLTPPNPPLTLPNLYCGGLSESTLYQARRLRPQGR
jgi:hypothetical protein